MELTPNPDIAAELGRMKKDNQYLVGFALETDNEMTNADVKLKKKKLDFIVMNSMQDAGAGFQTDTNKITIIKATGEAQSFGLKSKKEVATDIVSTLIDLMK